MGETLMQRRRVSEEVSRYVKLYQMCIRDSCITELEEIVIQGRELGQFVTDFIWYLRNLLLVQSADDPEGLRCV